VVLCDDDAVTLENLHRQLLYQDADVGEAKLAVATQKLAALDQHWQVEPHFTRFLPENALELARSVDLLIEGADNFATKFLAADAAFLAGRPIVHGAGVRWTATAWGVSASGGPCYRCLFEDVPGADAGQNCDEAGVMGPVLGIAGALMADLALSALVGSTDRLGSLFTYDGKTDRLRSVEIEARRDCPLCGARKTISDIREQRYVAPNCAA
jgi:adenylyltransferase/sulfurtransferase